MAEFVLLLLPKIAPFWTTPIFPALKLFDDLKDAIRSQGLGGHQAKILQQLSPKNLGVTDKQALKIRQQVTQVAIEKKLSVASTRAKVKEVLSNREDSEEDSALGVEAKNAIALVEKLKIDKMERADLEALETKLKEKLKQIRASLKKGWNDKFKFEIAIINSHSRSPNNL